jgi:uncharacterized protein (DUF2141 family)
MTGGRALRILLLLFLFCAMPASAATLTVKVANIDRKGGMLHVALYDETRWPNDDAEPVAQAIVEAVAPETTVVLKDVAPGTYGVKTYQDVNRNDKFDQGLFGLPLEPFGFSRDARPRLSEPGFRRTKFELRDGDNVIAIHLQ